MKPLFIFLILSCAWSLHAQTDARVKTVFITKFIDYTQWPQGKEKLTVGIVGNSEVIILLTSRLEKKNKNYTVKKITGLTDIATCHLVYVPEGETKNFSSILKITNDKSILVITEKKELAAQGAGVAFFTESAKLKFIVNLNVLKKANIKVSSELLMLGDAIE